MNSPQKDVRPSYLNAAKWVAYLIPLVLLTTSCRSTKGFPIADKQDEGWIIVKADKQENPDWIIYGRKMPDSNFLEYKIEGEVNRSATASIETFRQKILDLSSGVKQEKKLTTYELLSGSESELTTYVIHNEPFPLKDTEMSVRYVFSRNPDGSTGVTWQEAWENYPVQPSKKLNRIETFRGSWNFTPVSETSSRAVNSVNFDPKKMPLWLVEPMVFKFLKKELRDIKTEGENQPETGAQHISGK
ncbi:MAG: hypothetical protein AAFV07_07385 [Bacteroidota bacterium]